MNLKLLLSGIPSIIPGGVSLDDFIAITKIDEKRAEEILSFYVENGIGYKKDDRYFFEISDKLDAALSLIEKGALIDDISPHLDWKSFEGLTAKILESKDFATIKNLILTKPRMEIDVVGIKLGVAMLIDCKHWKRYNSSALRDVVKKQIERTKHYVSKTQGSIAIPVIVTLYQDKIDFIDKVPIVPILQFSSFVDEFYGNLEDLRTIETN